MEEVVTDAAAGQDVALESGQEGTTDVTEVSGETEGLDTQSADADAPESGQESGEAEGDSTEPKRGDKKTFEERFAQIEAKLTAQLEEKQKAQEVEKPNYVEVDMGKVNEYFAAAMAQIEALKVAGDYLGAEELRDELTALRKDVKDNEAKKADYLKRTQEQQQAAEQIKLINQHIEQASALVAKEHNIPAEVWKKGEDFFMAERQAKPLLDAQYREKVLTQGPVAALLFAKEYVEKHMGEGAKADQDAKNQAKQKSLNPTGSVTVAGKDVKTWGQLMKLDSKDINKFCRENPKAFQRLKDAHFK